MRFCRSTRRQFLLGAGGLGVAGLAGCSAPSTPPSLPPLDVPPPTYRRWIPADSELLGPPYFVFNVERLRSKRDDIAAESYESPMDIATRGDYVGVDLADMETVLLCLEFGTLILGDIDRQQVRSALASARYEQYEAMENVSLYRSTDSGDDPVRVAVSDQAVLKQYKGDDSLIELADTLFETRSGNRERLHERSMPYRQFTADVGHSCWVGGWSGIDEWNPQNPLTKTLEGPIATGTALYYEDGYARVRYWAWTTTDQNVPRTHLRAAFKAYHGTPESELSDDEGAGMSDENVSVENVTVRIRIDGSVVDAVVSTPIDDPGGGDNPPQVTVRARRSGGTLQIEHLCGDALSTDRIQFEESGGGFDRMGLGAGTLEPGETLSVDLPTTATGTIYVFYHWGVNQKDLLASPSGSS